MKQHSLCRKINQVLRITFFFITFLLKKNNKMINESKSKSDYKVNVDESWRTFQENFIVKYVININHTFSN